MNTLVTRVNEDPRLAGIDLRSDHIHCTTDTSPVTCLGRVAAGALGAIAGYVLAAKANG